MITTQSIAENHGGLYNNLRALRDTNGQAENNFFKSLGFDLYYLADGNDLTALMHLFKQVKTAIILLSFIFRPLKEKASNLPKKIARNSIHAGGPFSLEQTGIICKFWWRKLFKR